MVLGATVVGCAAPTVNTFDLDQSNGPRILLGANPVPTIPTALAANRSTLSPLQSVQAFTIDIGGSKTTVFVGRTDAPPVIPLSTTDVGNDQLEAYTAHDPIRPVTTPRVFLATVDAKPVFPLSAGEPGHDSLEAITAHDTERPITKARTFVASVDAPPVPLTLTILVQGQVNTDHVPTPIQPRLEWLEPSTHLLQGFTPSAVVQVPPVFTLLQGRITTHALAPTVAVETPPAPQPTLIQPSRVDAPPQLNLIPGKFGVLAAYEPFTTRDTYPTNQPVVARVDSVFTPPPTLTVLIQGQINTDRVHTPVQPRTEWLEPSTRTLQGLTPTAAESGTAVYALVPNRTNINGGLIPAVAAYQTPHRGIVAAIFWYIEILSQPVHPILQGGSDSSALAAVPQPSIANVGTPKIQIGSGAPTPLAPPVYLLGKTSLTGYTAYDTPQLDRGVRIQIGAGEPSAPVVIDQDVWHGRRRPDDHKRKAWPLPPPQFQVEESSPEILTFGDTPSTALTPEWLQPRKHKPRGLYRGVVSRPSIETPAPEPIVTTIIPPAVIHEDTSTQQIEQDQIRRRQRRRDEESIILSLLMQGEL